MSEAGVRTESFLCPNCGGTMKWNIRKQQFECASCRVPGEIKTIGDRVIEHDFEGYSRRDRGEESLEEQLCVTCSTCGAEVIFDRNETATTCSMCGSSHVAVEKQQEGVPPDGIIPFKVDKSQAQENFRKWIKRQWFAPDALKKSYQEGRLNGIYIPFWTYDAVAKARYRGQGGESRVERRRDGKTYTRTVWHSVSGWVEGSYDDIQVCATDKSVQMVIDNALPYNTSTGSKPYSSAYLSGFGAERYAIKADEGFSEAKSRIEMDLSKRAERDIMNKGYDVASVDALDVTYENVRYKHVLLPAWFSAFSYKGNRYLYLINGETGKVSGQRPYSAVKIIAAIAAVVIVIVLLINFTSDASAACFTDVANVECISDVELMYGSEKYLVDFYPFDIMG